MKALRRFAAISLAALSFASFDAFAVIDSNAQVVKLRFDDPTKPDDGCLEAGMPLNNCFTQPSSKLLDWIRVTRKPTSTSPLLVEVGPGTFERFAWMCSPGEGHVTFRGSGRGRTVFSHSQHLGSTVIIEGCEAMAFESLTISAASIAVQWAGAGSSTWADVEMLAGYGAWYETEAGGINSGSVCALGSQGTHKYFSTTLKVTNPGQLGGLVFQNHCGKNWFWGSEIVLDAPASPFAGYVRGISSSGAGNEVHLYGSNIRLFNGAGSAITSLNGASAFDGGEIHIHGTGIDLISQTGINLNVLTAGNGGEIHASQSAYVLKTVAPGVVTRINNSNGTGHIHAPYLWEHIPDSATVPGFTTANGADQTTVTSGTSDGHPHTAVYSSTCPSNARWYDQVDKLCRGQ